MATGKGGVLCNDWLRLLLHGTPIPGIADNALASPLTNLYLSLHTLTLSAASLQGSSEAAYPGYSRVAVARSLAGFTDPAGGVSNLAAAANFPRATGGSEVESYAMIGTTPSGSGKNLYWGAIEPAPLAIEVNVRPQLTPQTTVSET